jgi:Mn-dependent DtxR family transcriptional regulator
MTKKSNVRWWWLEKYGYLEKIQKLREKEHWKISQISRELELSESEIRYILSKLKIV